MKSVALTGANGFLGWHTRVALRELGTESRCIRLGDSFDVSAATASVNGSDRLIHIAGVNRGTDHEVSEGNARFAAQLSDALVRAEKPPSVIVFANSIQSVNDSAYGKAKLQAADTLRMTADKIGAKVEDVLLPNLFGEHGRPFYNAVTATFSHLLSRGEEPVVEQDRELILLHAQNAADLLIGAIRTEERRGLEVRSSVSGLLSHLKRIASVYAAGEIPDLTTKFDRDLFNTYRSYTFPTQAPIRLSRHADARGSFFEVVRSHGGAGQSSFSTTEPGVSRGDHFHRRKVERFTVLAGTATIALRRMYTDKVYEFRVTGQEPAAVDMPTMWTHKITNISQDLLYTSFWTNEIFNPMEPDTTVEKV